MFDRYVNLVKARRMNFGTIIIMTRHSLMLQFHGGAALLSY